jgi:hypothetical protein
LTRVDYSVKLDAKQTHGMEVNNEIVIGLYMYDNCVYSWSFETIHRVGIFTSVRACLEEAMHNMICNIRGAYYPTDCPWSYLNRCIRIGNTNTQWPQSIDHPLTERMPGTKATFKQLRKMYWDSALEAQWNNVLRATNTRVKQHQAELKHKFGTS